MIFTEPLPGLFHIKTELHVDERGSFGRVFSNSEFQLRGLCTDFVEWSESQNIKAHTLRGLHWQEPAEIKLIHCVSGAIFDVAVDLRKESPSFGRHYSTRLSAGTGECLYIPKGFAHGFQTLENTSTLLYYISEPYVAVGARGIRWDDPTLAIDWPNPSSAILSKRDKTLPLFAELFADTRQ